MLSSSEVLWKISLGLICVWSCVKCAPVFNADEKRLSIYLAINPKNHHIELSWFNLDLNSTIDPFVLITDGPIKNVSSEDYLGALRYVVDEGVEVLYDSALNTTEGRHLTHLKHSFALHRRMDFDTSCYNFWWHLVTDGEISDSGCMKTNAFWMNEMRSKIASRKFRQLFIPGTHDSASYKYNFDPNTMENLVTRYSLTQDDDILSQLVHGIRYLDMRVGYYRSNSEKFWANHGISRLHPLSDILQQVKEFVDATNEIVILDFQEFPVGFSGKSDVHRQFAFYLFQQLQDYGANPDLGWDATLDEIWRAGNRIIVAYDHFGMVQNENLGLLWQSVRHRWGKVKDGPKSLEKFLTESRKNASREFQTSRPFAEMAELTPEAVDVLTNRLGGLRTMASSVNFDITKLYHGDFGVGANVVAMDFYRDTNIVDIAIEWNKKKFGGSASDD